MRFGCLKYMKYQEIFYTNHLFLLKSITYDYQSYCCLFFPFRLLLIYKNNYKDNRKWCFNNRISLSLRPDTANKSIFFLTELWNSIFFLFTLYKLTTIMVLFKYVEFFFLKEIAFKTPPYQNTCWKKKLQTICKYLMIYFLSGCPIP